MATSSKPKKDKTIYKTPKGVLKYPHLNEPDRGTKDYPKNPAEFNTKLVLSGEEAEKLKAILAPLHAVAEEEGQKKFDAKAVAIRKKTPFKVNDFCNPIYDENEEETGEFEFTFKMKAEGKNRETGKEWTRTCPVFDAKGKAIPSKVKIGGGSIAKLSFTAKPYFIDGTNTAGLSLYIEGVMVFDLKSYSGSSQSATSTGFDADDLEDDGYEYEDVGEEPEDEPAEDEKETEADDEDIPF